MFLTAYGAGVELPQTLSHLPVLSKPFTSQLLAEALLALGDAEQALTAAQRSYTLLRREGDHASLLPLLARIAAVRGDSRTALKVAGYTLKRFHWDADRLRGHWGLSDARLAPDVPLAERAALITAGEQLGEEEAIRLVLAKGGGGASQRRGA